MDKAVRYVVYRFGSKEKVNLDDPFTYCSYHPQSVLQTSLWKQERQKYRYVVTALDRLHNESKSVSKKLKL